MADAGAGGALFGGKKAYARHRAALGLTGATPAAVRKADERGDIVWHEPGVIDFAATDARWASDAVQEAWGEGGGPERGEPEVGTAGAAVPTRPDAAEPPRARRAAKQQEPPAPSVVPRQQDADGNRLKRSRANREEVTALRQLRALQEAEGELMRTREGTALMMEVVGRVCDRMDGVPDVVTEDLVAMAQDWIDRARRGEAVEVDTTAIYSLIASEVRAAREGAAEAVATLRDRVLRDPAPE